MIQYYYKLGGSINGMETNIYFPATRSEINEVKFTIPINQVETAMSINYDEAVSKNIGNYDV